MAQFRNLNVNLNLRNYSNTKHSFLARKWFRIDTTKIFRQYCCEWPTFRADLHCQPANQIYGDLTECDTDKQTQFIDISDSGV